MIKVLDHESVLEALIYDYETGELIRRIRPDHHFRSPTVAKMANTRYAGTVAGTVEPVKGYIKINLCGGVYAAHRVIWFMVKGVWPEGEIDHINGDPADNRIENLREVTGSENCRNQFRRRTNTSGVTGVSWNKAHESWVAQICTDATRLVFYTKDFFEACCLRKSLELQHGYTARHGQYRRDRLEGKE